MCKRARSVTNADCKYPACHGSSPRAWCQGGLRCSLQSHRADEDAEKEFALSRPPARQRQGDVLPVPIIYRSMKLPNVRSKALLSGSACSACHITACSDPGSSLPYAYRPWPLTSANLGQQESPCFSFLRQLVLGAQIPSQVHTSGNVASPSPELRGL